MNAKKAKKPSFIQAILFPWSICLLAAFFYSYDFLLRVTPSVMVHPLMAEYGVNATQIGLLSAFYYYAYTPMQLPSGVITDKFGPRWVLTLAALSCALGALLFAVTNSLIVAYFARALMGFGSAFAFVGALKLAALWLPSHHFALFAGITTALGTLGAMCTDTVLSYMVDDVGWRDTVYLSAMIGFVLTVLLFATIRQSPRPKVSGDAGDYYSWTNLTYRFIGLFASLRFWINGLVGALLFLPVSVFASLWGVTFIAERFSISNAKAASLTSLIFLGMAVSGPLMGWLSEQVQSRKLPLLTGNVFALLLSILFIYVDGFSLPLACVMLFLMGFTVGPQILTFAIAKEISPPGSTGLSTAATNFIVTIGAAVFQPVVGYFLERTWDGSTTAMGTAYYSVANYREAFIIYIIFLGISLALTFFIPATFSKPSA